jgi:hypothetical protein
MSKAAATSKAMAHPSSKILKPKADAKVDDMYHLQVTDLRKRLTDANVAFKNTDMKHDLQALLAMSNLGLVQGTLVADITLLAKVTNWCRMLVRDQLVEISEKGLNVLGNKWDHVEVLIRAECDSIP